MLKLAKEKIYYLLRELLLQININHKHNMHIVFTQGKTQLWGKT